MPNPTRRMAPRVKAALVNAIYALPRPVRRLIAGRPIRRDAQLLDLDMQLLLRLQRIDGTRLLSSGTPEQARLALDAASVLAAGPVITSVDVSELSIPSENGGIGARLYVPPGVPAPSPLLVYYHGGGWVIGSLDSHDNSCRLLAAEAGVRVLSVDYRLAPEHPFPAATDDALTAYRYAVGSAASLGVDPKAIALGGDSAGGNLAAVTAHQAVLAGDARPVFLLLFYPGVDATVRRRSRDLFADGFFLTGSDIDWFAERYQPNVALRTDPRFSIMNAPDLSGLPPTYLATAGFDPLRDEGEAFAARLAEFGVPVVLRRHSGLVHGFVNFLAFGHGARTALSEAIGALRTGLALTKP
ncbi:MAG: alpha/beta hydrolase [Sciscionella sp.]